ncbi:hypothetical protein FKM95_000080 [Candidatus Tremblaya phenacola]|nr:hypothetical protein FKM95_000080 [Candidatus Tremblaya phenacola]
MGGFLRGTYYSITERSAFSFESFWFITALIGSPPIQTQRCS